MTILAMSDDTAPAISPYELDNDFIPLGKIDELQLENLKKHQLSPAKICSDAVFLRRVYLDLIGTLPTLSESETFLADASADKRRKLIDSLLEREEFALCWALKWGDILRIKSEFPINLWPNAVQAYSHWIWEAIKVNMPYDRFARELLVSSGSNFRDPPANFYRATQDRSPAGLAKVAALAFLGTRLQNWPEEERKEFEKLFSRISYKKTGEWKEEIVFLNFGTTEKISVEMPDGRTIKVPPGMDPRAAFADWLTGPAKNWFAQAAVNRAWFWLSGRGIVHEPDDFVLGKGESHHFFPLLSGIFGASEEVNMGNPPCNPELLDYLAGEFIRSGYDFKALIRLIANSATYQQSCRPSCNPADAEKYFAAYQIRRLDAEVISDALSYLADFYPKYMSMIPEPFTYLPEGFRAIAIFDGSISSSFLETFGRTARDTGYLTERNNETNYSQRLFLLNSPIIQNKVTNSLFLKEIQQKAKGDPEEMVKQVYLLVLCRYPSDEEYETVMKNFADPVQQKQQEKNAVKGRKKYRFRNANFACRQLVWALVNSKEFLFKH